MEGISTQKLSKVEEVIHLAEEYSPGEISILIEDNTSQQRGEKRQRDLNEEDMNSRKKTKTGETQPTTLVESKDVAFYKETAIKTLKEVCMLLSFQVSKLNQPL